MLTTALTAAGWPGALVLLAAACVQGWRAMRHKDLSQGIAAAVFAVAAVVILALIGVLHPVDAAVLAFIPAAAATGLALKDGGRSGAARSVLGGTRTGIRHLGRDTGSLWRRLAARLRGLRGEKGGDRGEMEAVIADHVVRRLIPPVRTDPALGTPATPEEITAAPVAGDHAAAISRIAAFEPETDADEIAFLKAEAAAMAAYAQAWQAHAEICIGSVGLDPAFAAGVLEAADSIGDTAHDLTLVHRRLIVIYAAVNEAIAGGLILPHNARTFLTGGEAA